MRNRTHLGDEKRQHSQGCDAQFDAMRPFEQGQPLNLNRQILAPSESTGNCFTQSGARHGMRACLTPAPPPAN